MDKVLQAQLNEIFVEAIQTGNLVIAKMALESGANVNAKKSAGFPLLIEAVMRGKYEVVEFLLENKVGVYLEDLDGNSAMHWAVAKDNASLVKLLLKYDSAKAMPFCVNKKGQTPLFNAKSFECADLLKKAGANINAKDFEGSTPMHAAARRCNPKMVVYLGESGADVTVVNKKGETALDIAKNSVHGIKVGTVARYMAEENVEYLQNKLNAQKRKLFNKFAHKTNVKDVARNL